MNPTTTDRTARTPWDEYKRRLFLGVALAAFLLVLANFVSVTLNVLLLLFLCVLIALGIRGLSDWVAKHTPLSQTVALIASVILIMLILIGIVLLIGSRLAAEFSQLTDTLQTSLRQIGDQVRQYSWGEAVLSQVPDTSQVGEQVFGSGGDVFSRVTGVLSSTLGLVSSTILVVFISLFMAAEPKTYIENFLYLIPPPQQERIRYVLRQVSDALQKWLLTRFISVIVIGLLTTIGLLVFGIPLAFSLGIIAALGGFIPTIGPVIAIIPAILVAFLTSPEQLAAVIALYLGVQMVENYLVTPLVQKRMLTLPPVYIIGAQLLFGAVAGTFGLVLAAPLAVVLVIVVRLLYVEDVLHHRLSPDNESGSQSVRKTPQ